MVHNLKIDVIYYDTPADFEFEFNLGGCCRSRILNSRASSPKEMLTNLSKAVSRSRIILVLGAINESDGLMNLISKAVGIPLSSVNKEEYFITSPDNPEILKGSLPLISKDGILAGCIVESGPQSIILLPDSKSLRKDITDSLVFPYITALSRTPETEGIIKEEADLSEEPITDDLTQSVQEEPEVLELPQDEEAAEAIEPSIDDESVTDTENAETEEVEVEVEEVVEVVDEFSDTSEIELPISITDISDNDGFIELEADKGSHTEFDDNYIITDETDNSFVDNSTDDTEDDFPSQPKGKLSGISIAILIICGLLLVIAAILVYLLVYSPISTAIPVSEYIKELFNFV